MKQIRVAIVGAGPAGIYAADLLSKNQRDIEVSVDLFEHLPAPYGLVRYGVSPDHPRIKGVIGALRDILDSGKIRLFGNVHYGRDISFEDLREHYNAVIFATGAIRDQKLEIANVDAPESYGAADFVSWFDGHPDVPRDWPLTARQVAVIGNGNVALDISRMLTKHPEELQSTEIPDSVLQGLLANQIEELHIFGRRGPGSVKFTPLELRELGEVPGVQIVLNPEDFEVVDAAAEAEREKNKQLVIVSRIFDQWLARQQEDSGADLHHGRPVRKLYMHFWSRPQEILTRDGHVSGIRIEKTRPDENGSVSGTGEIVDYEAQAVYRAVGYLGSPAESVPYDAVRGVIRNEAGRVVDEHGRQVPGVYATGWIKRGPVGLIGATKSDAMETTGLLLDDVDTLWSPPVTDPLAIEKLLQSRGIASTDIDGWHKLDAHEISLGQGDSRERVKVVPREEMISISRSEIGSETKK